MNNRTIEELMELLKEGVSSILNSREYKRYLKLMARFPSYSVRNTLLIYKQNPDATMVAGYQTWANVFGRHVRKGEKGIRILAPHTILIQNPDKPDEEPIKKTVFRSISVFDISQTEGRPLPSRGEPDPIPLEGECPYFEDSIPLLERLTGYTIKKGVIDEESNGVTRYASQTIIISTQNPPAHCFKTLVHECAHAMLHDFDRLDPQGRDSFLLMLRGERNMREVEAESVACLVSLSLGLDSTGYSFPYIAAWSRQSEWLPRSLERISSCAQSLVQTLQNGLHLSSTNLPPLLEEQLSALHSKNRIPSMPRSTKRAKAENRTKTREQSDRPTAAQSGRRQNTAQKEASAG